MKVIQLYNARIKNAKTKGLVTDFDLFNKVYTIEYLDSNNRKKEVNVKRFWGNNYFDIKKPYIIYYLVEESYEEFSKKLGNLITIKSIETTKAKYSLNSLDFKTIVKIFLFHKGIKIDGHLESEKVKVEIGPIKKISLYSSNTIIIENTNNNFVFLKLEDDRNIKI